MAWDKDKPAVSTDMTQSNADILANNAALDAVLGATKLATGTDIFSTTTGHDHDGTDSKKVTAQLGTWVAKTTDTVYQAATDGFVMAYGTNSSGSTAYVVRLKTDSSNPPTTVRGQADSAGANYYGFVICPVKKDDYYLEDGTNTTVTIYWIPLGS